MTQMTRTNTLQIRVICVIREQFPKSPLHDDWSVIVVRNGDVGPEACTGGLPIHEIAVQ
jgi:hypothetical protein